MKLNSAPLVPQILTAFVWLVRYLPKPVFLQFVKVIGFVSRHLPSKARRQAEENIELVLGLPAKFSLANEVMKNIPAIALESVRAGYDPGSIQLEGYTQFKEMVDRNKRAGKGVVFVTGHLGSWELSSLVCHWACHGHYYGLAKPSKTEALTKALVHWRKHMKVDQLWIDRPDLAKEMRGAINEGKGLGFAADQRPRSKSSGVDVDFMGRKTPIVTGPAWAAKDGAPVMSIYVLRTGPMRYKVLSREVVPPNHRESSMERLTALISKDLEQTILEYPEQWMWTYKRWPSESLKKSISSAGQGVPVVN